MTAHLFIQRLGVTDLEPAKPHIPSMREVAALVAIRHSLTIDDLKGPRRTPTIVHARHEAMAIIRAQGRFSLPQIGRFFGNRHHTTVMHGLCGHERRAQEARAQ